ncbi:MAG: class I SAM-dependent methyltransferase [Gammaproteobacteria bacterium]
MPGPHLAGIGLVVATVQESSEIWCKHARQWDRVGQPLRPTKDDVAHVEGCIAAWSTRQSRTAPRVLLLGVTPELADLNWPSGTTLVALDRAPDMIAAVWPGDTRWRHAICADWFDAPFAPASWDLVVGDGALNMIPTMAQYPRAVAALGRLLAPGGRLLLRLFARPAPAETVTAALRALEAGEIDNFHIFKWRLAMALHGDSDSGVRLADIWQAWQQGVKDPQALAARQAWATHTIQTIDAYRNQPTRYTFPTLAELRALLSASFVEDDCQLPDYDFGHCCPRFVLRRGDGTMPL